MKTKLKLLVSVLPFFSSACAHAPDQPSPTDSAIEATFPAIWMRPLIYAFEDFQMTKQDLACFTVSAYRHDDSYFVHITPEAPDPITPDGELIISSGDVGICGFGIEYEFDSSGQFIRKIYNR